MIKERPILLSSEMVGAILDGRKTKTRRIVKPQFDDSLHLCRDFVAEYGEGTLVKCPYGKPGDVLYVRETWCQVMRDHAHDLLEGSRDGRLTVFKTDFHTDWMDYAREKYGYKWHPSIHMPKDAARIWLKVKDVRVERLHDMSEHDAIAEGIEEVESAWPNKTWRNYDTKGDLAGYFFIPIYSFSSLWVSIYGAASWLANPWVWVIEFEVLSTTGKPAELNG